MKPSQMRAGAGRKRLGFSEPKALEQALMLRAASGLGELGGVPALVGAEMFEPATAPVSAEQWQRLWKVELARWPERTSEYPEPMYLALEAAGVPRDQVRAWTATRRPTDQFRTREGRRSWDHATQLEVAAGLELVGMLPVTGVWWHWASPTALLVSDVARLDAIGYPAILNDPRRPG